MGNTLLTNPHPEIIDDRLYLKDVSETQQEQSGLESTLEISGMRMYFDSERKMMDYDSNDCFSQLLERPSNEQTIKLISVGNNRDILKITLLLEDVETERKWDTSRIGLHKEMSVHNYLPQNKNNCEKPGIISHQLMQLTDSENLNFSKECEKYKTEEFVKTGQICRNTIDYSLDNENIFYVDASTDKSLALKCETTTQPVLREIKDGDSQISMRKTKLGASATDLNETKHGDSKTDLRETKYGNSQISTRETKHSDSQTSMRETKRCASATDLNETKHGDSQTDLKETKHGDSQISMREIKHSDSQTSMRETKHGTSATDFNETKHGSSKLDLRETKDGDSQTSMKETKHGASTTDLNETKHGDSQTDLKETKDGDTQISMTETKHSDSQTSMRETKRGASATDFNETKHGDSQTNLKETKHGDSQTDLRETKHGDSQTYALDLTFSHTLIESTIPLVSKHSSAQCDNLQKEGLVNTGDFSLKTVPNDSPQTSVSTNINSLLKCAPTNKITASVSTQTISTEKIHKESQTETSATDFLLSRKTQALTESNSLQDFANCYIRCNELNKDRLTDTESSTETISSVTSVVASKKISSPLSQCVITLPRNDSTTETDLKETKGSNTQTDMILHSVQTGNPSQTNESYSVHKKTISTSKNYKEGFNESTIKNSKLLAKEHITSLSRLKFPTALGVGVPKRSRHPIFPSHLYKQTSLRRKTNRPSLRRNNSLYFSPKNSDAITFETVSLGRASIENKRKRTLNSPTTTRDVRNDTTINPTWVKDNNNCFQIKTLFDDYNKTSLNPNLTSGEYLFSTQTEPTNDVKKYSLNEIPHGDNKIPFLNSKLNEDEHIYFLYPLSTDERNPPNPTFISDARKNYLDSSPIRGKSKYSLSPTLSEDEKKYPHTTPTRIIAKCLTGNSRTEKVIPIPLRIPSLALEWAAKSFHLLRNEPVESIINPACIEFVEYPTRDVHNLCLTSVDCCKINENIKHDISKVRSESKSQNLESVSTAETEGAAMTVVFGRKPFLASETNHHFMVSLCDDCYAKTQLTVDEFLMSGGATIPSVDEHLTDRSTAMPTVDEYLTNENSAMPTVDEYLTNGSTAMPTVDEYLTNEGSALSAVDGYLTNKEVAMLVIDEYLTNEGAAMPAVDEVELKPIFIESSSSSDEVHQERESPGESVVSELPSVGSLIESLHPSCEVVNDHLTDSKQVDKNLLRESVSTLTKRWLSVAADLYSRTKEVCNYLQYFQEFSDNLSTFVLHSTDSEGNNALHFAFGNNRFDMAEELLNNKHGPALLRKRNKLGHTPLMICAISQPVTQEDWETVKKSVKLGNVNEASQSSGQTALMNAASRGCAEMVRVLLDAGADPNQRDGDGSTALMYATEQGQEACVALLLEHADCDPHIKDQDGQTASSIAIGAGYKDIALRISLKTKKIPSEANQQKPSNRKNIRKNSC